MKRRAFVLLAGIAVVTIAVHAQQSFVIKSASSGLVLDVPKASLLAGTQIEQWPANGGLNQAWRLKAQPDGYEIVSAHEFCFSFGCSTLELDVPLIWPGIPYSGALIEQDFPNGGPNQLWTFNAALGWVYNVFTSDYVYEIASVAGPSEVLDVPSSSNQAGKLIQTWARNDGANQQWVFVGGGTMSASGIKEQTGSWITVSGEHFPPNASIDFRCLGIPGQKGPQAVGNGGADANGNFQATFFVNYTSNNINDAWKLVTVVAEVQGFAAALGAVSGTYWYAGL